MSTVLYEQHNTKSYQVFLQRLGLIESNVLEAGINFNPSLSLKAISATPPPPAATNAWCIVYIVRLLKNIAKGQHNQKTLFFPQDAFYSRLEQSLREFECCFELFTVDIRDEQDFLLGIGLWELIQALNPKSCLEASEIWAHLHLRSQVCRSVFVTMPKRLNSKLRMYFCEQIPDKQLELLAKIRNFEFHTYLKTDLSPTMIRNMLSKVSTLVASNQIHSMRESDGEIRDDNRAQADDVLGFLEGHFGANYQTHSTTARTLERALEEYRIDSLDCFDSAVVAPNLYSYLRPADKLRLIFDAIVFKSGELPAIDWSTFVFEFSMTVAPEMTQHLVAATDGTRYIRTKLPNYTPRELNAALYNSLDDSAKKNQYQKDALFLLQEMRARIAIENQLKTRINLEWTRVTELEQQNNQLINQLFTLLEVLHQRVDAIAQFNYSVELTSQYETLHHKYFGIESLFIKLQDLKRRVEGIEHIIGPDLKSGSELAESRQNLNDRITYLQNANRLTQMANQFTELADVVRRCEAQYEHEYRNFIFPQINTIRVSFPQQAMVRLLVACMAMVVSIGILTGNPYFAFLVLPILMKYMTPIGIGIVLLSAGVMWRSGVDLVRYRFLVSATPAIQQRDHPETLQDSEQIRRINNKF